MTADLSAVAEIVESVFESMLGLTLRQVDATVSQDHERTASSVHLSGEWNGVLLLECTKRQACAFAGRFLSIATPDEVDADVRDVMGELANMVGGNLKGLLGRGIQLSMPSVVDGDYHWRFCGAKVVERLAFGCADGNFGVVVMSVEDQLPSTSPDGNPSP